MAGSKQAAALIAAVLSVTSFSLRRRPIAAAGTTDRATTRPISAAAIAIIAKAGCGGIGRFFHPHSITVDDTVRRALYHAVFRRHP